MFIYVVLPKIYNVDVRSYMSNYWQEFIDSTHESQRLDYVWRFSTIPISVPENVSTHSYWVILYSAMIHNMHNPNDTETLCACVIAAMLHDYTEHRVGDFVRPFKYRTEALKLAIDEAENLIKNEFSIPVKNMFSTSDRLTSKSPEYVKSIVKAADFMSLYTFMIREFKRGNNEIVPFFERMIVDLDAMAKSNENVKFITGGKDFEPDEFYTRLVINASKCLYARS